MGVGSATARVIRKNIARHLMRRRLLRSSTNKARRSDSRSRQQRALTNTTLAFPRRHPLPNTSQPLTNTTRGIRSRAVPDKEEEEEEEERSSNAHRSRAYKTREAPPSAPDEPTRRWGYYTSCLKASAQGQLRMLWEFPLLLLLRRRRLHHHRLFLHFCRRSLKFSK